MGFMMFIFYLFFLLTIEMIIKKVKEFFDLFKINQLHIEKYDTQDYLFNMELLKCYEQVGWNLKLIQSD